MTVPSLCTLIVNLRLSLTQLASQKIYLKKGYLVLSLLKTYTTTFLTNVSLKFEIKKNLVTKPRIVLEEEEEKENLKSANASCHSNR